MSTLVGLFNAKVSFFLQQILNTPSCKFFTEALADGLSLESDLQQFSSGLQHSSPYSGQSQQCCSLDGLISFFNF